MSTKSTLGQDDTLNPSGWNYVRHHAHTIASLPPATESWTVAEIRERDGPTPSHLSLPSWEDGGVVERLGETTPDDGKPRVQWSVTPEAHRAARALDESTPRLDCCPEATGFTNLGDGTFGCSNDDCDAVHSRERIKEVFVDG